MAPCLLTEWAFGRTSLSMSDHPLNNISADALRQAADIRDQIEALQASLDAILTGSAAPAAPKKKPGRPKGSANKVVAAAAEATAETPAASGKKKASKRKGGKRVISPEGLERIRAAQKARWAKVNKGNKGKKGK
jgi:hypothetical protein